MERLPIRRLHREAVPPAHANAHLHAGNGEALWAPPLGKLLRLYARREHALSRRSQQLLEMERRAPGIALHSVIIRPSGKRAVTVRRRRRGRNCPGANKGGRQATDAAEADTAEGIVTWWSSRRTARASGWSSTATARPSSSSTSASATGGCSN